MMKNLKINVKLLISFGLVLLMLLICSGVGVYNMNKIGEQVDLYATKTVPNVQRVWQIRRDMISAERNLLTALVQDTQAETDEALAEADANAAELLSTYDAFTQNSRTDQETLDELSAIFDKIVPIHAEISTLLKNWENQKAFELYETEYLPLFDHAAEILVTITESQNQRAEDQNATADSTLRWGFIILIATLCIALVITLIVMAILKKAILTPIQEINVAAQAIAKGDLSATITYDGKDELGELSNAMKTLLYTVVGIIKDLDYVLGEVGKGNFTVDSQAQELYIGDFASLEKSTKQIVLNLSSTLTQINIASEQVATGSDQVSSGAQALSQGTTEQASTIEELAAAISDISEQIKNNAANAESGKSNANEAGTLVTQSNELMQQMISAMDVINNTSNEIGKIIKTIDDIAFQTNILALNAAVEAARAGEAGKGFAVVADEVRNLAGKSAESAKSTQQLIESSIHAVENGVQIAERTAVSLLQVVEKQTNVTSMISEIAIASADQANSIMEVTQGVDQISAVVQTNAATAEESAAASEELNGQAQILKDLVDNFKLR